MCNILDARGFIHFIYFTERKGALNEEPSRPRGRGRQITIASARGWRRQTRNKNVNFRIHPLTDTLALAVSFAEHFQFRPSQRSNRNGLSRIYFYGALVPFLWLFLLWQSICQKPFFSLPLFSHPVLMGSRPSMRLFLFPPSTSHPTTTSKIIHEFDLSSLMLLLTRKISFILGLALKWHLLRNGSFSSSILLPSTAERKHRTQCQRQFISHIINFGRGK